MGCRADRITLICAMLDLPINLVSTPDSLSRGNVTAKFILFFLIIFLSIAVNLPDSMITRMGFDANYLFAALAAVAITGLIVHRRMLLVILVILSTIGANLPIGIADQLGLDRDIMIATLIALVVIPYVAGKVEIK